MNSQRRLPLDQALLGFLMQGPMHGYDLHRRAESELGRIWYMGLSNVYGALKRLEQTGQVESTLSPQESRELEFWMVPDGPGRMRLTWELTYDDAIDTGRRVEFADAMELVQEEDGRSVEAGRSAG